MRLLQDLIAYVRLSAQRRKLIEQENRLNTELEHLEDTDPRRILVIQERELVQQKLNTIFEESDRHLDQAERDMAEIEEDKSWRDQHPDLYRRPLSFMNKRLGPIPQNAVKLRPTKEQMRDVETHSALIVCMCITSYLALHGLPVISPWLAGGLNALWNSEIRIPDYTQFGLVHVISAICILMIFAFSGLVDRLFYGMAADREQRFTMGSENWTWPERAYSYFASVVPWVMWLLFFPSLFIAWVCLPVPILSKLYLDTFKRTEDYEYATLTTTKLYGQFMKYFLLTTSVFTLLPWIMTLVF